MNRRKFDKVKLLAYVLLTSLLMSISYNFGQKSAVDIIYTKTKEFIKEEGH